MAGPVPAEWAVDPRSAGARRVAPGLWRLRLPMAWDGNGHANAFVVEGDGGPVLFDCGSGGDRSNVEALEVALGESGWAIEDVSLLVVTHAHSDHVGLAGSVTERAGCELWMHPAADALYDGHRDPRRIADWRRRGARRVGVPADLLDAFADVGEETLAIERAVLPDRGLRDGDRVPTGVGEWTVLETPGHAPSHVCLWQPDRRWLVAGDVVFGAFAPWFDLGYSDDPYAEWQASLDRIDRLGPIDLVLAGHGRPLTDGPAMVERYRSGMRAELEQTAAAVGEEPLTPWAICRRAFGETRGGLDAVWRMSCVLAYLRHLDRRGRVERISEAGSVRYRSV